MRREHFWLSLLVAIFVSLPLSFSILSSPSSPSGVALTLKFDTADAVTYRRARVTYRRAYRRGARQAYRRAGYYAGYGGAYYGRRCSCY